MIRQQVPDHRTCHGECPTSEPMLTFKCLPNVLFEKILLHLAVCKPIMGVWGTAPSGVRAEPLAWSSALHELTNL